MARYGSYPEYLTPGAYQPDRRIASGNYGPGTRFQYAGRNPMDMSASDSSGSYTHPSIRDQYARMNQNLSSMGGNPNEGLTPLQQYSGMGNNLGNIPGMFNRFGRSNAFRQQHPNFYGAGGPGNINTGDGTGFWSGLGKSLGSGVESFFGKPLQAANTLLGIGDYFQKGKSMDQYGDYLGMLSGQIGDQKEMSDKTWDAFTRQRDRDEARVDKFDESQKLVEV